LSPRPNQHGDFDRIAVLIFCLFIGISRVFALLAPRGATKKSRLGWTPGRLFLFLDGLIV
jgi:hypothetical protein